MPGPAVPAPWKGRPPGPLLSGAYQLTDLANTAPTLRGLANGSAVLSNEIDNRAAGYQFLNLDLLVRGASAFVAGQQVDCWVLTAIDGTTYEDGAASVIPGRPPDATFYPRAVATQQRIESTLNPVPPCKFKVLVRNTTITSGVAFTNTNGENVLTGYLS